MNPGMMIGKLPPSLLNKLIDKLDQANPNIIIPPKPGIDAAGLKLGNKLFAISTDPVSCTYQHIGTHCVSINMNDVACLGAKPIWFTATVLLPEDCEQTQLDCLWDDFVNALDQYDVKLIGGHTEITPAVNKPIIVGQMLGECIGDALLDPRNCEPDDHILLWQPIALEGTAIIATDYADKIKQHFSSDQITSMQDYIHQPGLCVWPLVEKLLPHPGIVALHDPTHGGIANALHELANSSQCGIHIEENAIPILPETKSLCTIFGLDPLGLLATGSLLIVCKPDVTQDIMQALADEPIRQLGKFTSNSTERLLHSQHELRALPQFNCDELSKLRKPVAHAA